MVLRHSGRVDNCRFKEKPSNILKNMFEGFLIYYRQDILFLIAVVFLLSLRALTTETRNPQPGTRNIILPPLYKLSNFLTF